MCERSLLSVKRRNRVCSNLLSADRQRRRKRSSSDLGLNYPGDLLSQVKLELCGREGNRRSRTSGFRTELPGRPAEPGEAEAACGRAGGGPATQAQHGRRVRHHSRLHVHRQSLLDAGAARARCVATTRKTSARLLVLINALFAVRLRSNLNCSNCN